MQDEIDYETVQLMELYGGSFVKALAECCRHADPHNFRTLKKAFPAYFAEYNPDNWKHHAK